MQNELQKNLQNASTDEEKQKLIDEFMNKAAKVTEQLEKEKANQLEALRKKLAERRSRMKAQLHR